MKISKYHTCKLTSELRKEFESILDLLNSNDEEIQLLGIGLLKDDKFFDICDPYYYDSISYYWTETPELFAVYGCRRIIFQILIHDCYLLRL